LCNYDITFPTVGTSQIRIIDMTVGGTQSSNVNFREIQVWQGSLSNDDIGISAIDSPGFFCNGPQNIVARVQNFGKNVVTGFNVNWSLNGTAQTPIASTSVLDTMGGLNPSFTQITLASGYLFPSTPTLIKAWTSSPNNTNDTIRVNDTSQVTKQPSISGNYTIDPAGSGATNFTSFASAISALSASGVCGPVNFTVAPGTYTNQIIIGDKEGAYQAPSLFLLF
jgi:hypothetical protein